MGVHESQSLLWERMVALSLPFSKYLAPKLAAAFPQLGDLQVCTIGCLEAIETLLAPRLAILNCSASSRSDASMPLPFCLTCTQAN